MIDCRYLRTFDVDVIIPSGETGCGGEKGLAMGKGPTTVERAHRSSGRSEVEKNGKVFR